MRKFAAFLFVVAFMTICMVVGISFDDRYEQGLFYMVAWLVGYQLADQFDK